MKNKIFLLASVLNLFFLSSVFAEEEVVDDPSVEIEEVDPKMEMVESPFADSMDTYKGITEDYFLETFAQYKNYKDCEKQDDQTKKGDHCAGIFKRFKDLNTILALNGKKELSTRGETIKNPDGLIVQDIFFKKVEFTDDNGSHAKINLSGREVKNASIIHEHLCLDKKQFTEDVYIQSLSDPKVLIKNLDAVNVINDVLGMNVFILRTFSPESGISTRVQRADAYRSLTIDQKKTKFAQFISLIESKKAAICPNLTEVPEPQVVSEKVKPEVFNESKSGQTVNPTQGTPLLPMQPSTKSR